jgi:hypothetical protein
VTRVLTEPAIEHSPVVGPLPLVCFCNRAAMVKRPFAWTDGAADSLIPSCSRVLSAHRDAAV